MIRQNLEKRKKCMFLTYYEDSLRFFINNRLKIIGLVSSKVPIAMTSLQGNSKDNNREISSQEM